jgi:hypothetical protein
LKKQTQFARRQIELKAFFERRLWQNIALRGTKKQSQIKANIEQKIAAALRASQ